MKKILLFLILNLFLSANAHIMNLSSDGDVESNEILKNFLSKLDSKTEVVSHFFDIDNDKKDEVIGIAKSGYFYSLEGYKLFVLKEKNDKWEMIKSDVYFDIEKDIKIKRKKITFYKPIFFGNKKCKAKIKKDKIVTSKSLLDRKKIKQAHSIEEIIKFNPQTTTKNEFELENFNATPQREVDFHYVNLNKKTKHYLNLK